MLKNMLNLEGIKPLNKQDQKAVKGKGGCLYACLCHYTNTNPLCCCVN